MSAGPDRPWISSKKSLGQQKPQSQGQKTRHFHIALPNKTAEVNGKATAKKTVTFKEDPKKEKRANKRVKC